ncbi:hypothetical protein SAMN05444000_12544 [Shimia gijangensis]|uniref:Uncharacterized protein n=1 Tax=Shimia gijangensis TaxID=1470563 RepID=A0A1M6RI43_9RHOB|nr:hypothetical protein SAMN05444000_12544 [Shimia gijangensis]
MAYDEGLATLMRDDLTDLHGIEEKKCSVACASC